MPLRFNDGRPVPDELIADTLLELEDRFGAVSCETQRTRGYWRHEGASYRDELVRVYLDVPDIPENHAFFARFKEQLKVRFQQIEIWMTTYPLEVIWRVVPTFNAVIPRTRTAEHRTRRTGRWQRTSASQQPEANAHASIPGFLI